MIIITAVGSDRPGMAHAVADKLSRASCNIEDTTMTRLCGEFAMILIVSPPPQLSCSDLSAQLTPLEKSHGLYINCREITDDAELNESLAKHTEDIAPRYVLSVYGPENQGLVARITGVLAEHNVNITDVQTRVASAGAVYVMIFEIEVPPDLTPAVLQAALETAGQEINVQVSLRALEEDTL